MKLVNVLRRLGVGFYASIKRYPITLLFSTSVAILLIILSEMESSADPTTMDTLTRYAMMAALGIPLSLCARALYERGVHKNVKKLSIYYMAVPALMIPYYSFFLGDLNVVTVSKWIGINLALYLCFLFIPYLKEKTDFEMHVIHLFTSFLITYVYAGVLYLGLSAILFAMDHLLSIPISEKMYFYTFLVVALIFSPAYFLTYVPEKERKDRFEYSKILKVLLLYIVMPLLTAYTLILYLYFGRILITMTWPKGLVSHLVLWYALVLTVVLFLITPIYKENKWSRSFSKWFPRVVLPVLIMMFVSMGIRIRAYGFTENRYYVLILGLWIFAMMAYLSITKNKKNILLLISLSLVIVVSTFGPISSFEISKKSQNRLLEDLLIKNGMLVNGEIKDNANIPKGDQHSISSILSYFENNHSLKEVKFLPEDFSMTQMEDTFGFPFQYPTHVTHDYFYYMLDNEPRILDISEHDCLIDFNGMDGNQVQFGEYEVEFSPHDNILWVSFKGQKIIDIQLSQFIEDLYARYGNSSKNTISDHDLILEGGAQNAQYRLVIRSIGGQRDVSGDFAIDSISFYLLLSK